ncbi:MAG: PAS domain S-box protein [Candidatus Binataceae bacterium]
MAGRLPLETIAIAFETAPLPFAVLGLDFKIISSNRSLARLLGHSSAELRGRPASDFVAPEDRPPRFARIRDRLARGLRAEWRGGILTAGGKTVLVKSLLWPVKRERGEGVVACGAIAMPFEYRDIL